MQTPNDVPHIRIRSVHESRIIRSGIDGKELGNSLSEPFDPPVVVDRLRPVFEQSDGAKPAQTSD